VMAARVITIYYYIGYDDDERDDGCFVLVE